MHLIAFRRDAFVDFCLAVFAGNLRCRWVHNGTQLQLRSKAPLYFSRDCYGWLAGFAAIFSEQSRPNEKETVVYRWLHVLDLDVRGQPGCLGRPVEAPVKSRR